MAIYQACLNITLILKICRKFRVTKKVSLHGHNSIFYYYVSPYAYIHKITNNKIKHVIHIYTQVNQYRVVITQHVAMSFKL